MKVYKAAIIGLGPSGLAVNKLIYDKSNCDILALEYSDISSRDNYFGFWFNSWMKPYESIIEKKWENWDIGNKDCNITHSDNRHPYSVITYKKWKNFCLETKNNINIVKKKVTKYFPEKNYYKIVTDDNHEYFAEKIYDSRISLKEENELNQHFFGVTILTPDNTFDDNKATLMYFTEIEDVLHFIYLLPFSHNKALVESTVFSKKILNEKWYRNKIEKYLKDNSIKKIKELSTEKGTIPMYLINMSYNPDPNIINIGIRGGACKASTGYAFAFMIKQIQLLKKNYTSKSIHNFVDRNMDRVFLNYLKNNSEKGLSFIKLAKNLNGNEFQSFMMGQSKIMTKIKIIKSMPKLPFIKAFLGI